MQACELTIIVCPAFFFAGLRAGLTDQALIATSNSDNKKISREGGGPSSSARRGLWMANRKERRFG